MRSMICAAATLAVALGVLTGAQAQSYPSKPITMIVPFVAGGPLDVIGRLLAEPMRVSLGQPIVIENVGGAAGTIGIGRAARAPGDGYTLSIGNWATHVVNGAIYKLNYHPQADFEPVGLYSITPQLIVVRADHPAKDLQALIAWLRANPNKASMATSGVGSAGHVAGAHFQRLTDTSFQFIPHRGLAPAMQSLLGGQIQLLIDIPSNSLPHLQAGKVRALAVLNKERMSALPDIPTVDEAGVPGLHAPVWYALWATKGTPKDAIAKLNAALVEAIADPTVRARFAKMGQDIVPRDQQRPEALGALHKAEIEKWWPIIRAAGIKAQ
jgi:tripartite-type tricarboxylate transporter receptor subunit TctC